MSMTSNNRDNILTRFVRNHAEAGERLKKLQEYHDNHFDSDPDNLNWGDVESATKNKPTPEGYSGICRD